MSAWNFIGILAWLIVLAWLIFTILNTRKRHLKMIIKDHKKFTWRNLCLDIVEVVVFLAMAIFMVQTTFLRVPNLKDSSQVKLSYQYKPLVLKTDGAQGYYVEVQNGNGKKPVQYFTYWVEGARYEVNSNHARVATGGDPLAVNGAGLPWPKKVIKQVSRDMPAFVAQLSGTYRPTFINGLGMHVGNSAEDYYLISVPSEIFVNNKDKDQEQ